MALCWYCQAIVTADHVCPAPLCRCRVTPRSQTHVWLVDVQGLLSDELLPARIVECFVQTPSSDLTPLLVVDGSRPLPAIYFWTEPTCRYHATGTLLLGNKTPVDAFSGLLGLNVATLPPDPLRQALYDTLWTAAPNDRLFIVPLEWQQPYFLSDG